MKQPEDPSRKRPRSIPAPLPGVGLRSADSAPWTLIIGYGNPLRSDDGFGWHAGRSLAQSLEGKGVEVMTCHQLTPELAEPLARCALAIFLDADCQGVPGEINSCEILPDEPAPQAFTHACTPSGLLANAEKLYGHRPQAFAITVGAQSFDFGETLSPLLSAALPKALEQVGRLVVEAKARSGERGRRSS